MQIIQFMNMNIFLYLFCNEFTLVLHMDYYTNQTTTIIYQSQSALNGYCSILNHVTIWT